MTRVFADTYFFLAVLNTRDPDHERALEYFGAGQLEFVTTGWVMTEMAAALSPRATRGSFVQLYDSLRSDPAVVILPPDAASFERGLALYRTRTDKDWSLVDCISFGVMEDTGMTAALTGDHHFAQAGFTALLG